MLQFIKNLFRKKAKEPKRYTDVETETYLRNAVERGLHKRWGVKRNSQCPCGSGLKYKNCCMKKLETT